MEYNKVSKGNQEGEKMNIMMRSMTPRRGSVKRDIVGKFMRNMSYNLLCMPSMSSSSSSNSNRGSSSYYSSSPLPDMSNPSFATFLSTSLPNNSPNVIHNHHRVN